LPLETDLLDYELPQELIAQRPLEDRSGSRLLVMDRRKRSIRHRRFTDLAEYLRPGDLLVLNDSRVFPARLFLRKETGAKIELLFLRALGGERRWEALARPGRKLREGMELYHEALPGPFCRMAEKKERGLWNVEVIEGPLLEFLDTHGVTPLPPYVKKSIGDPGRYQTVYAAETGSTAAPTAGMHFTGSLMAGLEDIGVRFARVTLHIGIDTFRPISEKFVADHDMHTEHYSVTAGAALAVADTIRLGGRVVAVGTTAVRTLESWAAGRSREEIAADPRPASGDTDLFIYEKEQFSLVDAMITNFHLPKTTLLALVCAFAGREFVLEAYGEAIRERYRFYSFGDAMLIV